MLSKQEFEAAIQAIADFHNERSRLDDVIKVISPSSTGVVEIGGHFIDQYVRLLSLAMGEEPVKGGFTIIEAWIYDYRMGERCPMEVNFGNGEVLKITTAGELYDFFVLDTA